MPQQISTTPEQSRRLLACGVPADTADMCWSTRTRRHDGTFIAKKHQTTNLWIGYPCWRATSGDEELENIPAWSLARLLELIPRTIVAHYNVEYYFSLAQEYPANDDYKAAYKPCWFDGDAFTEKRSPSPFEACVQLVEYLAADGYKLNRPQKTDHNGRDTGALPQTNNGKEPL